MVSSSALLEEFSAHSEVALPAFERIASQQYTTTTLPASEADAVFHIGMQRSSRKNYIDWFSDCMHKRFNQPDLPPEKIRPQYRFFHQAALSSVGSWPSADREELFAIVTRPKQVAKRHTPDTEAIFLSATMHPDVAYRYAQHWQHHDRENKYKPIAEYALQLGRTATEHGPQRAHYILACVGAKREGIDFPDLLRGHGVAPSDMRIVGKPITDRPPLRTLPYLPPEVRKQFLSSYQGAKLADFPLAVHYWYDQGRRVDSVLGVKALRELAVHEPRTSSVESILGPTIPAWVRQELSGVRI